MLMKDRFNAYFDLGNILKTVLYSSIFLYISILIWPYINLPFANPLEIHGYIAKLKFNPFTNSVRYLVTLLITMGGTYVISLLPEKKRKIVMRLLFIAVLVFTYFLTALIRDKSVYNIDLFHDGEQIGNAALFLKGRSLFDNVTFYHGAFTDPLIAVSAFSLFGKSVGSYLLLTSYLRLISFLLFFILLFYVISSELIFYLAALWFFGFISSSVDFQNINFIVSTIRDINVWLTLITLWSFAKNGFKSKFLISVIGFLAGSEFIISFDRAYVLTIFMLILLFYLLISKRGKETDGKGYVFQHQFSKENIGKNTTAALYLLAGFAFGFFLQLPLIGYRSFLSFLKFAFWEFPRLVGVYSEHVFPSFSSSPDSWFPIIGLIFCGIFIYHTFLQSYLKKEKAYQFLNSKNLYLLLVFVFSLIFFRIAIIRDDLYHLFYGSSMAFLAVFLVFDSLAGKTDEALVKEPTYPKVKNILSLGILLYLVFNYNVPGKAFELMPNAQKRYLFRRPTCYIDPNKDKYNSFLDLYLLNYFRCPPEKATKDISDFFSLPDKPDSFWISKDVKEVIDFINARTSLEDFVFVYNNEPGYYYYLNAKSPTRFSEVSMADNKLYRAELFNDIKRNQPKIVLYSTGNWPEALENIWIRDRFPEIEEWLAKNYPQKIYVNHSIVLLK